MADQIFEKTVVISSVMLILSCATGSHQQLASSDTREDDALAPTDAAAEPSRMIPENWNVALEELQTTSDQGIFSFSFFGAGPGDTGLSIVTSDRSRELLCSDVVGQFDPSGGTGWQLWFETSSSSVGVYDVVYDFNYPPESQWMARVVLERYTDGALDVRHVALGGDVRVSAAPTNEQSPLNDVLELTANLEFPTHAVEEVMCSSSGAVGEVPSRECLCRDRDGEFTCEPTEDILSCCVDLNSPREVFSLTLRARHCGNLCRANSLLFVRRCNEIRSDNP